METLEQEYERLNKFLDDYVEGKFDEDDLIIDEVSNRLEELEQLLNI